MNTYTTIADGATAPPDEEPITVVPEKGMSYAEYEREMRRRRVARIRYRAARKAAISHYGSQQALAAKARLIIAGKGKNGRSMSPALLERHISNR
jgi:hypothetical protein